MIFDRKPPKIGLALGGGGARGYAHIGVIKALEKNKIPIDYIAGTSAGALMGCLYAFFKDSQKLEEVTLSTHWRQFITLLDPSFCSDGIIEGKKIKEFIGQFIEQATFDQLKIPFRAVATDFKTAQTIELSEGDVAFAVRASLSYPLFFKPVPWQDKLLLDGELSSPVPVNTVRKMGADVVIAVNLDNESYFENGGNSKMTLFQIAVRSIRSLQYHLAKECVKSADIVIEPKIKDVGLLGLDKFVDKRGQAIILEGERLTELIMPEIKKIILPRT